ncbi:AsmA family protein [Shimia sediminis]|uniref:AsmA family protein n=1 Tax=Shimia sediminis TaxID=2497945 RepID=UPI000F8F2A74|nr:AsmA family protein [Shimia sediminis]
MSFKRVLISIVAVLAFLFVLGWMVLSSALFSGLRASLAEGVLTKQLGRDVQIAGDLRISPGSTITVTAEGLILPSTSLPDTNLASLGLLAFDLSFRDLIAGKITLSNLETAGATLSLVVDKSGANSWSTAGDKPAKTPSDSPKQALDPWALFADHKVAFADTKVRYLNALNGLDLDLTLATLSVVRDAADAPLILDGTGDLNGEALTLSARIPRDTPLTAEIALDQITLTASGTPVAAEAPDTRTIALSADIRKLSQFLDIVKLQKPIDGTGKVSALFTSGSGPSRIDKLNVVVDLDTGQSVVVTGNIGELGNPEDVSLTTRIRLYPEDAEPPKTATRRDLKLVAVDMVIDSVPGQIAQRSMKIVTNGFVIDTAGEGPPPIKVGQLSRSDDGKLRLGSVNLRIGQPENPFLILDGSVGDALKLAEIDATGTLDLPVGALLSTQRFQDSDVLGHLVGELHLKGNVQQLTLTDVTASAQGTDLWSLDVGGTVRNVLAFQNIDLTASVKVPSSKALLEALHLNPVATGATAIEFHVESEEDDFYGTANINLGESDLRLTLDVDDAQEEPVVHGTLTSDLIQVDHLKQVIGAAIELRKLNRPLPDTPDTDAPEGPFRDTTLLPLGQALLTTGMDMDLQIDLRQLQGAEVGSSLQTQLTLDKDQLSAGPVSFEYGGGTFDVEGQIDLSQEQHILEIKGSAGGWGLLDILELVHFKKAASGTLYSNFDVSGPVTSVRDFVAAMNGSATVSMRDGHIQSQLLDLAGLGILPWLFSDKEELATISCLRMPMSISNGRITTKQTAVETNQVQIVVYGDVDLGKRTIDIHGQPRKIGEPLKRSPWPFTLSGSLKDPKVKVKDGPKRLKRKDGADTMPAKRKACVPDILQLQ